jgi:hypothetical protein
MTNSPDPEEGCRQPRVDKRERSSSRIGLEGVSGVQIGSNNNQLNVIVTSPSRSPIYRLVWGSWRRRGLTGLLLAALVLPLGLLWPRMSASPQNPVYPIEKYITTSASGSTPAGQSSDYALLGIHDGASIDEVINMFPRDVFPTISPDLTGSGYVTYTWAWKGILLSVDMQVSTRSTSHPHVLLESGSLGKVYASLPRGLMLGRSTVADIVKAYGQPDKAAAVTETDGAPFFYLLKYGYGAEGAFWVTYAAAAGSGNDVPQPDGVINSSVCDKIVDGFEFGEDGLGGARWPATPLCT